MPVICAWCALAWLFSASLAQEAPEGAPTDPAPAHTAEEDRELLAGVVRAVLALHDDQARISLLRAERDHLVDRPPIARRLWAASLVLDDASRFGPLSNEELRAWLRGGLSADVMFRDATRQAAALGANPPAAVGAARTWPANGAGEEELRLYLAKKATLLSCVEAQTVVTGVAVFTSTIVVLRAYVAGVEVRPRELAWLLESQDHLAEFDVKAGRRHLKTTFTTGELVDAWNDQLMGELGIDEVQVKAATRLWPAPRGWPEYDLGLGLGCSEL